MYYHHQTKSEKYIRICCFKCIEVEQIGSRFIVEVSWQQNCMIQRSRVILNFMTVAETFNRKVKSTENCSSIRIIFEYETILKPKFISDDSSNKNINQVNFDFMCRADLESISSRSKYIFI